MTVSEQKPEILDVNFILANKHLFKERKKDDGLFEEAEQLRERGISEEKINRGLKFLRETE